MFPTDQRAAAMCCRTMSDCVSTSEQQSTMAWLGGWPLKPAQPGAEQHKPRTRRASCKGIEGAMAGGLGKPWYY